MKEPKNVKELYEYLTKYLTYRHLLHQYHNEIVTDIMELSKKGGVRNYLSNRIFYNGRGFILSYGKTSTNQEVWRMYIHERSA